MFVDKAADLYTSIEFDINDANEDQIYSIDLSSELASSLITSLLTDFESVFVADNRAPFLTADTSNGSISVVLGASDQPITNRIGTYTLALEYYLPGTDLS